MEPLRITHFSDVLCVWAYVTQVRMDKLVEEFGSEVAIDYRYVSVFGFARDKLEERWRGKGGLAAYGEHVAGVVGQFEHVPFHRDLWSRVVPISSMPAHLLLCAVRLLEREGRAAPGSQRDAAWHVRQACFRDARDISDQAVLVQIAGELGLDVEAIAAHLAAGRAHAELARDADLTREQDIRVSPTVILNEGRQRMSGNVGYRVLVANVREVLKRPAMEASWC
ncbi:MAG: DsbA family protein [Pseudomonadota bacterium]|nr:DsbA family protein [Pseudomonadota bacterium]